MLIKDKRSIPSSEITSETVYLKRREFLKTTSIIAGASMAGMPLVACSETDKQSPLTNGSAAGASTSSLNFARATAAQSEQGFYTDEKLTPEDDVKSYCNFYEFGSNKTDPLRYASNLTTDPWTVQVEGEAEKTGEFSFEDIIKKADLVERVYRFRCVEAWSMVVPWVGVQLSNVLKQFNPTSKAKYVSFETLYRPEEMRGQRSAFSTIDWPYVEGLRIDEAMHPLTLLATGLYGKSLPSQNGAPLRLIVPWKYGFKSIKSIVKIRFTEQQPPTSWNVLAPREYGFYSNVNPNVSHPRWSQAKERRLPSTILSPNRIDTAMFNGYADQVSSLYKNMDLTKYI